MIGDQAFAAAKLALATAATSVVAPPLFGFDHYIVAFIGVPFTVVGMSAAGAMMSFAFGSTVRNRKKLFFTAIAATLIGAAAVTGVPAIVQAFATMAGSKMVVSVPIDSVKPVMGFFYALFCRWLMPLLIDAIPTLFRRWFRLPATPEVDKQ